MMTSSEIRKKYYDVCYKQKLNFLFNNEQLTEQFYAQRKLIESMVSNREELDATHTKAVEKAEKDFNFFTSLD